ncbi:mitochondrial ribosomal protein S25 [Staphylotrichum tortipilum]|uniref:37S ribosomal protein S25, mitochondrial n=1 Tax=Staphylotrichum tortipilum TaxID=2831512 RepID=A0AAN6RNL3_9PEZI|nr:mitochondrial ribosomal protein S25 [Staphylotrichum longicolle]
MGSGRQFRAARVYEAAQSLLVNSPHKSMQNRAPAWLSAVVHIPPSEILTRPYPPQNSTPPQLSRRAARRGHRLFRPTKMVYPEDELRRDFFRDHPWELARPKLVLELDGTDARDRDWSKGIQQEGMRLSGESVVQRQLWLMEVAHMSKDAAYDKARKEFYALRQREDIERRIASEEARMYGAYFGQSNIQVSMGLEDAVFDKWKHWATGEIERLAVEKAAAYDNVVDAPTSDEDLQAAAQ